MDGGNLPSDLTERIRRSYDRYTDEAISERQRRADDLYNEGERRWEHDRAMEETQ
jgi:hypothetical protein